MAAFSFGTIGRRAQEKYADRKAVADLITMGMYGAITGLFPVAVEFVRGYTTQQVTGVLVVYAVLKMAGSPLCGDLTDWVRTKLAGGSVNRIRLGIADTVALGLYEEPLYIGVCLLFGVSPAQLWPVVLARLSGHSLWGWAYGLIKDWVYTWRWFRINPGRGVETTDEEEKEVQNALPGGSAPVFLD